jgi:hypothetical protein
MGFVLDIAQCMCQMARFLWDMKESLGGEDVVVLLSMCAGLRKPA